jgi:hypothetical protein
MYLHLIAPNNSMHFKNASRVHKTSIIERVKNIFSLREKRVDLPLLFQKLWRTLSGYSLERPERVLPQGTIL